MNHCVRSPSLYYIVLSLSVFACNQSWAYTAYVTNERDNTVSVIDLDQIRTIATVPVGQRPRGIAVTPDGNLLLVCASDDDTIQEIDTKRCTSSALCRRGRIQRASP